MHCETYATDLRRLIKGSRVLVWLGVILFALVASPTAAQTNDGVKPNGNQPTGDDAQAAAPSVVKVEKTDDGFVLLRNGKPLVIKGAGGRSRLDELVATGGNSIRTWHVNRIDRVLDEARDHGLFVTVGLWLGHERHGFNYDDEAAVKRQHDALLAAVKANKDHPAVLMWGIGNEMEGDGSNPKVWKAVNDLAKAIKAIDPNHPAMTVVAGTYNDKIREFVKYCPDIDVLGVNAYGELSYVPKTLKEQGMDRPYVITEFGPFGWWQVEKTSWGAELEPTSSAKAATYLRGYEAAVTGQPGWCLGAYAFLWGDKQEHTHTWFGMFHPYGERTASVDVMHKMWRGEWPDNRCPNVGKMTLTATGDAGGRESESEHIYKPKSRLLCTVEAIDPDGDPLRLRWELRGESTDKKSGGDREEPPAIHKEAIVKSDGMTAEVELPEKPGPYRVFVDVLDGKGNVATANVPVLVK